MHVIEAKAAFNAQAVMICGPIASFNVEQFIVLDIVGQLAPDPAVGTDRFNFSVRSNPALRSSDRGRKQGTGWAGLNAFAAGDTGAIAHWVVEIENDLRLRTPMRHPNHVIDLNVAACADTQCAVDAGIQVDRHRRVRKVRIRRTLRRETAVIDTYGVGPTPER